MLAVAPASHSPRPQWPVCCSSLSELAVGMLRFRNSTYTHLNFQARRRYVFVALKTENVKYHACLIVSVLLLISKILWKCKIVLAVITGKL